MWEKFALSDLYSRVFLVPSNQVNVPLMSHLLSGSYYFSIYIYSAAAKTILLNTTIHFLLDGRFEEQTLCEVMRTVSRIRFQIQWNPSETLYVLYFEIG